MCGAIERGQFRRPRRWQRRPQFISSTGILETRRHDTGDGEQPPVDVDLRADDRRVAPEPAPPQSLRQEHGVLASRRKLLGSEAAAERRLHAKHAEEIRRDHLADDELWLARPAERKAGADMRRHRLERLRTRSIVFEVERGHAHHVGVRRVGVDVEHQHQAFLIGIREGPQQHGVDDAEHQRGGADAERQRQRGGQRESRGPQERPHGKSQILEHSGGGATPMPAVRGKFPLDVTIFKLGGIGAVRSRSRPSRRRTS